MYGAYLRKDTPPIFYRPSHTSYQQQIYEREYKEKHKQHIKYFKQRVAYVSHHTSRRSHKANEQRKQTHGVHKWRQRQQRNTLVTRQPLKKANRGPKLSPPLASRRQKGRE